MKLVDRLLGFLADQGLDEIEKGGLHVTIKKSGQIVVIITPEGNGDFINIEDNP